MWRFGHWNKNASFYRVIDHSMVAALNFDKFRFVDVGSMVWLSYMSLPVRDKQQLVAISIVNNNNNGIIYTGKSGISNINTEKKQH